MIICAGESLVDVLPTDDGGERAVPGGGPMNTAIATARLGAPTAFVGRISTDASGTLIRDHLVASNVDLSSAQFGDEPTARAIVVMDPTPLFRFEGDATADASMTSVDLGPLGPGPHILHGGTLGILRGTTAGVLAGLVTGFDGAVSFDPNIRPQVFPGREAWLEKAEPWLARADVIKVSDDDLDWMAVEPGDLLERGAAAVLKTMGPDGVDGHLADGSVVSVPASPVPVVDSVGAGDSFIGAVLTGLHRLDATTPDRVAAIGADRWRTLIEFGISVAAITVARVGADPPWRHEVVEPNLH